MVQPKRNQPRVLVLAPRLPLPPRAGEDLRVLQTVTALARSFQVAVFGLEPGAPEPPEGVQVWRFSQDPALRDPRGAVTRVLKAMRDPDGHPYDRYTTTGAVQELEALIDDFAPDVTVVETLSTAGYVDVAAARGGPVVLNAHNVEARLRRHVLAAVGQGFPPAWEAELAQRQENLEARTFSAVDQIWACSGTDAGLIRASYPSAARVRVVPNCVDVESYAVADSAERRAGSMVFPASFAYPPNAIAASWLALELLPVLQKRFPEAEVVLVGGQPTPEMTELAEARRGVTVLGAVPDIRPHLASASAMAVPLFQGSGTRYKVLEAFASSLPVVSTAKGVEGLEVEDGKHVLLAETPEAFADALARLWTDADERARIVRAALELVRERYSWEAAAREMEAGVRELASR